MTWQEQLEIDGFTVIAEVFTPNEVKSILAEWDDICRENSNNTAILANDGPVYGARNRLQLWPSVIQLARSQRLSEPLLQTLSRDAGVVRALYFDKPPGHTWALPWHKDYNIAVAAHGIEGLFTKPTTKAGVPHVLAPFELLDQMLTVRIHLDDMTTVNGPLRVLPGSHRFYDAGDHGQTEQVTVKCRAGDVLLMRPLLTHASGHSTASTGTHRRIVHLECASSRELADGYLWHDFVFVAE